MNATANASNKLICETAWSSCCVYFIYETRSESWVVWCLRKRDKKKTQNQVNTQDCQWSWKLLHVCLCGSCVAGARVLGWKNIFIENGLCTHTRHERCMPSTINFFLLFSCFLVCVGQRTLSCVTRSLSKVCKENCRTNLVRMKNPAMFFNWVSNFIS